VIVEEDDVFAYKVVSRVNRKLYSFNTYPYPERLIIGECIEYVPNRFVYPKILGSKLYVFDSLQHVELFLSGFSTKDLEIWKCKILNPGFPKKISYECDILGFWRRKRKHLKIQAGMIAPKGTISCHAVMLTERIES
jgi:hypothetical protein